MAGGGGGGGGVFAKMNVFLMLSLCTLAHTTTT